MNTQTRILRLELETEGWKVQEISSPISKQYWWVWESWILTKDGEQLFLSFLIDPQSEKRESNVWAVSANKQEPIERLEAEAGPILTLGRGWKNRLKEFISAIRNSY
ncbi:MAG: hypothetical protein AB8B56_00805 [Crocinitomicaceae bacterium]